MQFPIVFEELVDIIYATYRSARDAIQYVLEETLVKANPAFAAKYADALTLLVSLTALLLVFEYVSSAKKVLMILVTLGWAFLILSIAISL